jgi:hypothetical protein
VASLALVVEDLHLVVDLLQHVLAQLLAVQLVFRVGLVALVVKDHGRTVLEVLAALLGHAQQSVALLDQHLQSLLHVQVGLVQDLAARVLHKLHLDLQAALGLLHEFPRRLGRALRVALGGHRRLSIGGNDRRRLGRLLLFPLVHIHVHRLSSCFFHGFLGSTGSG